MDQKPERFYEVTIELKPEFALAVRCGSNKDLTWYLNGVLEKHGLEMVNLLDQLYATVELMDDDDPKAAVMRGILADRKAKDDFACAFRLVTKDRQRLTETSKVALFADLKRPSVDRYITGRQYSVYDLAA